MIRSIRILSLLSIFTATTAGAQAWAYPELQTPRIVDREYNFEAASASRAGTSFIFQWREALETGWQSTIDAGFASPRGDNARVLLGGSVALQATRATDDFPFDIALTGGVGFSFGGGNTLLRIPVGAVVGHSFDLDGGYRISPYAHPRFSIDRCSSCPGTKLGLDLDLGVDFVVTPQLSLRLAALIAGSDYAGGSTGVGLSVAWTPLGLRK